MNLSAPRFFATLPALNGTLLFTFAQANTTADKWQSIVSGHPLDLTKFPELRPVIVERLKAAGKQAKAAGVIIGIETSLPAADEVKLLDDIGSPAIN